MKTTKRIAALLMAVVMVFALCSTALAISNDGTQAGGTLNFKKSIYVKNSLKGDYYSPNITFTYTIEPASAEEVALAAHAAGSAVYAGINGALVGVDSTVESHSNSNLNDATGTETVQVIFASEKVTDVTPSGVEISKEVTLNVDATKVTSNSPGAYRYKITDTTSEATLTAAGIVRPKDYDKTRFIDVYLELGQGGLQPAVIVVSDQEVTPDTDSNGNYINKDDPTETFDKDTHVVDDDGNVWELTDEAKAAGKNDNTSAVFPDDYQDTGKDAKGTTTLDKDGGVFDETPTALTEDKKNNTDNTDGADDLPDDTSNDGKLDEDDGVIPGLDDDGNLLDEEGNSYPGGTIDPTDGTVINENGVDTGKKAVWYTAYDIPGDTYTSYNVSLKKVVEGGMGNRQNQFPFEATVNNSNIFYVVSKTDASGAESSKTDVSNTTASTTLADTEVFHIRGLNPNATINYTETNNTPNKYTVKATDKDGSTDVSETGVEQNGTFTAYSTVQNVTDYAVSYKEGELTKASAVVYTNTLASVSPTGVVLRFAPYILMLGAAMFFVVLARKQREQENA